MTNSDVQTTFKFCGGFADRVLFEYLNNENLTNKHFESSQKLRKDGIGIWKNFIGNMLSNNIL